MQADKLNKMTAEKAWGPFNIFPLKEGLINKKWLKKPLGASVCLCLSRGGERGGSMYYVLVFQRFVFFAIFGS